LITNLRPPSGLWEAELQHWLPQLGHRNWIVVADSAYPSHANPGITTLVTGAEHLEVLRTTLAMIAASRHIRAKVYLDAELNFVAEQDAMGVSELRRQLGCVLRDQDTHELPHEEIIANLDERGKRFRILILKTTLTIAYSSVFLELDAGYWDGASEHRLRAAIAKGSVTAPDKAPSG
jgi:L-fucose mutarotase/ribose pyranase (RbsD/FucU family)